MLTNVAYGIAPFKEKPTVIEAMNKRINVVVNFYKVPYYVDLQFIFSTSFKIEFYYVENIKSS